MKDIVFFDKILIMFNFNVYLESNDFDKERKPFRSPEKKLNSIRSFKGLPVSKCFGN